MSLYPQTAVKKEAELLFQKHKELLDEAINAYNKRIYYTPYPETPKAYSKEDYKACLERFEAQHGQKFERLKQDAEDWLKSDEVSPYTREEARHQLPRAERCGCLHRQI